MSEEDKLSKELNIENIHNEYNNWKWLTEYKNYHLELVAYVDFFNLYNESEKYLENLEQFKEILNRKNFILSNSAKGNFVRSIQDKEVAKEVLIAFSNGIDSRVEGEIQAIMYKKGLKSEILEEKEKFTELLKLTNKEKNQFLKEILSLQGRLNEELRISQQKVLELDALCQSFSEESDKQKRAALDINDIKKNITNNLKIELEAGIENANRSYSESTKKLQEQLEKEKSDSKNRIEGFIEAYQHHMKLKAPVQYWKDNCEHHKKAAKGFGIASLILSLIIFLPIAYVAWEILATEEVIWGKVGVVAFTSSLAIWLIRVLVRMYLSHNHMQMNSQERVVMTQAYLALISEGGATSDEERNLVLQAIFRPISTGIVTDDAAPHNIIELINKNKK